VASFELNPDIVKNNSREVTDEKVEVCFWYQGGRGSCSRRVRNLDCPTWDQIGVNYPKNQQALEGLMDIEDPFSKGQIILWHGPPGTGKTYALRALFQAWDRIHVDVVVDPEKFFNDAEYLNQVIFSVEPDSDYEPDEWDLKTIARRKDGVQPRNRGILLVMEDAADYILATERARRSAPIARLLNLTDGLIGQGLKLIVLITTNEPLGQIDPAVSRPGRCLQVLEFPKFSVEEARLWLREQDRDDLANSLEVEDGTLADLYAIKNGRDPTEFQRKAIGFRTDRLEDFAVKEI